MRSLPLNSLKSNLALSQRRNVIVELKDYLLKQTSEMILHASTIATKYYGIALSRVLFYQAWYGNKDSILSAEAQKLNFNQLQPTEHAYSLSLDYKDVKWEGSG